MASTQESSKRVTFYESVRVLYIAPVNKVLKKQLFYNRSDYERFEYELYVQTMLQERALRALPTGAFETSTHRSKKELCIHACPTTLNPIPQPHVPAVAA